MLLRALFMGAEAQVVQRCFGVTFHGLLGCGARDVVDVVKLTMKVAYFTLTAL